MPPKNIVDLLKNLKFPKTNSEFYQLINDKQKIYEFLIGNELVKTTGLCQNIKC